MRLNEHEQKVLDDLVRRLKTDFRAERVLLYGSAARGDMGPESDIDLLAVMPEANWEIKKRVCDLCFDAELDIGRIISVLCVSKEAIENTPMRSSPLILNVREEGVPL